MARSSYFTAQRLAHLQAISTSPRTVIPTVPVDGFKIPGEPCGGKFGHVYRIWFDQPGAYEAWQHEEQHKKEVACERWKKAVFDARKNGQPDPPSPPGSGFVAVDYLINLFGK